MTHSRLAQYWMPVFIWLALIYVGSTDLMSAEHTSRFFVPVLRWLNPEITADAIAKVQFFVRKLAHLTEYAILAALLWRAVYRGTNLKTRMSTVFVTASVVSILIAASDEFHQSFVSSRTASAGDVLIDMIGAIIGLMLGWSFTHRALRPLADRQSQIE